MVRPGRGTGQTGSAGLLGRASECALLDEMVAAVRTGQSRVLVVHGAPGVGKSALLEYAERSVSDMRVLRAAGVECETELPFAALHQLCAPLLEGLGGLPAPQCEALETVFGMRAGTPPERFLVALAVLSLLSDASEKHPLLCVVDDAQWMDRASAQVLGFVARRLLAESVALIFGSRERSQDLLGLPELEVTGLTDADAHALLDSVTHARLDQDVRSRVVAETRGNPLALLELPRGLSVTQMAGGFGLLHADKLPDRIEQSFLTRINGLSEQARLLLLIAAAEPTGDPILVWGAAELLGVTPATDPAADMDGLLTLDGGVIFRHPLVRSAVYGSANPEERRLVHLALAEVTDEHLDPDRRAWHLASAAGAPDESVAAELERSAGRAQARGGLAAAAAFMRRSMDLTADTSRRAERALAAADASLQAGDLDAARKLADVAERDAQTELRRARADLLHGQIAFASSRGSDASRLLLKAARQYEPLDSRLARETYLDALSAVQFSGRLALGGGMREVAEAARAAPPTPGPPRAPDLLLDGLALLICDGYPAGAPVLRQAVSAFRGTDISKEEGLRWLWLASRAAWLVWDYDSWELLCNRQVTLAREAGALIALPIAFNTRAGVHLFAGEFTEAASMVAQADSVTGATGSSITPYGALSLAVFRGLEAQASHLIQTAAFDAGRRGEGAALGFVDWAVAVLCNSLGRYEQALTAAQRASEDSPAAHFTSWTLVELIEAAARAGVPERAASALKQLSDLAQACGTDWALGVEARSRALVSDGTVAESLYREAIERLGRTLMRPELARAHLLYGEWLRRDSQRVEARSHLRTAHEMFTSIGMEAFAERARRELLATGETVRKRTSEASSSEELTPQERQIALLVRDGLSNPEVAAQLFLSPRTVEWHLRKIFAKLGISSRRELARTLPGS